MMDVDAIILYQLTNKPDDTTYIPVYNPSMAPYDFVAYSLQSVYSLCLIREPPSNLKGGGALEYF